MTEQQKATTADAEALPFDNKYPWHEMLKACAHGDTYLSGNDYYELARDIKGWVDEVRGLRALIAATDTPASAVAEPVTCEMVKAGRDALRVQLPNVSATDVIDAYCAMRGAAPPTIVRSDADTPAQPQEATASDAMELAAKAIYSLWDEAQTHSWDTNPHGFMQETARKYARAALAAAPKTSPALSVSDASSASASGMANIPDFARASAVAGKRCPTCEAPAIWFDAANGADAYRYDTTRVDGLETALRSQIEITNTERAQAERLAAKAAIDAAPVAQEVSEAMAQAAIDEFLIVTEEPFRPEMIDSADAVQALDDMRRIIAAALAIATKPAGASGVADDARDAARYRWIRDQNCVAWHKGACVVNFNIGHDWISYGYPKRFEEAVDAGMAASSDTPNNTGAKEGE